MFHHNGPLLRLEKLPAELLENVFFYLTPFRDVKRRTEPKGWVAICKSLRLTCSLFAQYDTLEAALFYEIIVLTEPESLQRLQAISLSDMARSVKCALFHPWLVDAGITNEAKYDEQLYSETRENIQERLVTLRLPSQRPYRVVENLMANHFPFTQAEISCGFEACLRAYERSEYLGKMLVEDWRCALAKMPNLKTIRIGREADLCDDFERSCFKRMHPHRSIAFSEEIHRTTYLQRYYPEVLIRSIDRDYLDKKDSQIFIMKVLEAISAAGVVPHELSFLCNFRVTDKFFWEDISGWEALDLSQLRVCRFDDIDDAYYTDGPTATPILLDEVLLRTPCLEELRIGGGLGPLTNYTGKTNLRKLTITNSDLDYEVFAEFLNVNTSLREVEMGAFTIYDRGFFDALRQRRGLDRIVVSCVWGECGDGPFFDGSKDEDHVRIEKQVMDYVTRKGGWTKDLDEAFFGFD